MFHVSRPGRPGEEVLTLDGVFDYLPEGGVLQRIEPGKFRVLTGAWVLGEGNGTVVTEREEDA